MSQSIDIPDDIELCQLAKKLNNGADLSFDVEYLRRMFAGQYCCDLDAYEILKTCSAIKDLTQWNEWRQELKGDEIYLQGADLRQGYYRGADFSRIHFEAANFAEALCERANFWNARCEGADFNGANCQGVNFGGVNCQGADFRSAHCQRAWFVGETHCEGADFRGAHCEGTRFWEAHCQGTVFEGTRCEGAEFNRAHCQGASFYGADFDDKSDFRLALIGGSCPFCYFSGLFLA